MAEQGTVAAVRVAATVVAEVRVEAKVVVAREVETVAVATAGVRVGAAKERHTLAQSIRARQRKRQLY